MAVRYYDDMERVVEVPELLLPEHWEGDTERACDEEALRQLPPDEHAAYGRTILEAVARLKT